MFSIFKQRKELETMKSRLRTANEISDHYCGWVSAYRFAIHKLHIEGAIDEKQYEKFFAEAEKYHNMHRTE